MFYVMQEQVLTPEEEYGPEEKVSTPEDEYGGEYQPDHADHGYDYGYGSA